MNGRFESTRLLITILTIGITGATVVRTIFIARHETRTPSIASLSHGPMNNRPVGTAVAADLGALDQNLTRDPFQPYVAPRTAVPIKKKARPAVPDSLKERPVALPSVVMNDGTRAILHSADGDQVVRAGSIVGEFTVTAITDQDVTLERKGHRYVLPATARGR